MAQTLTFSEQNKGWTGESPFKPGGMTSLSNRFYSFKGGQLYLHNDKENPVRCNFYGEQFTPRIKTVFNDNPELDKIFKTLVLEGDTKWKATVETNFVKSTVRTSEFVTKESREFAYLRQEESETSMQGGAVQGVGNIDTVTGLVIDVSKVPENTNVGDALFQITNGEPKLVGTITEHTPQSISIGSAISTPTPGSYCFIRKVNRIEGAEVRGYYMEVTLTLDSTENAELFAIGTNAVKSGI